MKTNNTPNRWLVVFGAILIQLALGALYAWSVFTKILTDPAGIYQFTATQTVGIALTMTVLERAYGLTFFDPANGGDPILYQHLFWFYSHPAVYIMILPAMGAITEIIPTFARKTIFGYKAMIISMLGITVLSFVVWAHHMFTTGMPVQAELFFMYATMLISVPTGVKVFNWVSTMWQGSMTFETPMLFAIGFVVLFTIGGLSGLMLAITAADFQYHDTYFVVAHFHYVLVTGALYAIYSAVYFWLPKWTGNMYDEKLGKLHFWVSTISVNVLFFPMHFVGLAGMPRRIPDYNMQFAEFNQMATIGAFVFGFSQLILLWNVVKTIRGRSTVKATDQVWEGAEGLEWTLPSPAPFHSFTTPPTVK